MHLLKKSFILLSILAFTLTSLSSCAQQSDVNHVDSPTFADIISKNDGIILDVRTTQEFAQGHIEDATLISTNDPQFVSKINLLQKDKAIYVYCLTGSRSNAVARYMYKNGFTNVYNLKRGVMEWQRYGYALTKSSAPSAQTAKTYNSTEFNDLLFSSELVLIDFHAPWCAPCKKMAPVVDQLKAEYINQAVVEKIDVQANKSLQTTFNIESIPGLVLLKNGKEVWRHTGVIEYDELSKIIEKYL